MPDLVASMKKAAAGWNAQETQDGLKVVQEQIDMTRPALMRARQNLVQATEPEEIEQCEREVARFTEYMSKLEEVRIMLTKPR